MENANVSDLHIGHQDAEDDAIDILNDSIHNLSLEEHDSKGPLHSTPIKPNRLKRSGHEAAIGPCEGEPPPKDQRLHGDGCKKRRKMLESKLKETYVESPDKKTDQSEVMELLKTSSKSLTTRAVKDGLGFSTEKPFEEMSEKECNNCLSSKLFNISSDLEISEDLSHIDLTNASRKTNTTILPLSLENNSTLAGTCTILDQFSQEFSLPSSLDSSHEKLPFDNSTKTFCLKQAREHAEFVMMMNHHSHGREAFRQELSSSEANEAVDHDADEQDTHEPVDDAGKQDTTVRSFQKLFESEDNLLKSTFDSLKHKVNLAIQNDQTERLVKELSEQPYIRTIHDHLGRTLLHAAVEELNLNVVECLIHVGCNPNAKEKCGCTPLILAVILKSKEICKLLVSSRASVRGALFVNVPSPIAVAKKMELVEILQILDPVISDEEDADLSCYDPVLQAGVHPHISRTNEKTADKTCNRHSPGFLTGIVGDVGTCKTNRGVMSRTGNHEWVGIIPGDMHNKGYLAEACLKEQGPGGFHYLVKQVLKRPKLTKEAFKKKKFGEGNLDRIREAVRDGARSYGLAAVMEFKKSPFYPDPPMLLRCHHATNSHTKVLLEQLKLWIADSISTSAKFKYRSRMFLYFGPLLELYDNSTSHCLGLARETCFMQQLPAYAQLNFPNYYTECFVHVVNFIGKWPLAFRQILRQNCSVNVTGRNGCGLELDAYVEAEIVQPLKRYVSGHTSVKMCERLMGSLDILKQIRFGYTSKDAFDVHSTTRHSVADPFQDQLKGAWYCLRNGWLSPMASPEDSPLCFPVDGQGNSSGKVPKCFLDVHEKGLKKIKADFSRKLYDCFPDLRYELLLGK